MDSSYNSITTKPLYKGIQIVWYLLGLIEALLGLRFVLKLLGANPFSEFVSFIYNISQLFLDVEIINQSYTLLPLSYEAPKMFQR